MRKFIYYSLLWLAVLFGIAGLVIFLSALTKEKLVTGLWGTALLMYLLYRCAQYFDPEQAKKIKDQQILAGDPGGKIARQKVRTENKKLLKKFFWRVWILLVPLTAVIFLSAAEKNLEALLCSFIGSLFLAAMLAVMVLVVENYFGGFFNRRKK